MCNLHANEFISTFAHTRFIHILVCLPGTYLYTVAYKTYLHILNYYNKVPKNYYYYHFNAKYIATKCQPI